jgi:hypothetical protein
MKSNNTVQDNILNAIFYLESKNTKLRNITPYDLFDKSKCYVSERKINNDEKIKSFSMQEEFGPKKRIKP